MGIYQVLVCGDTVYGTQSDGSTAAANPSELGPGAYGIFTPTGGLLDSSLASGATLAAALVDLKEFFIAVMDASGSLTKTPMLQRRGVVDFRGAEYAAPVRQVTNVVMSTTAVFPQADDSLAATGTLRNVGQEITVRIINTMVGTQVMDASTYSVSAAVGSTNTTIVAALVAAINADPDRIVTASNSTATTLTLTDTRDGGTFRVAVDGLWSGISPTYTTAFDPGSGTVAQLAGLERLSQAHFEGVLNQTGGRGLLPYASALVAGETYDQYFLDVVNRHNQKDGMDATFGRELNVLVAIPDDGTNETAGQVVFQNTIKQVLAPFTAATLSGAPEPAVVSLA